MSAQFCMFKIQVLTVEHVLLGFLASKLRLIKFIPICVESISQIDFGSIECENLSNFVGISDILLLG